MARQASEQPEGHAGLQDPAADPVAVAREIVLRQLALRDRTRAELDRALRSRGVPDEVADQVLERFTEVGLVDDEAFAARWVETADRRLRSRTGLRQELAAKGVDPEIARDAVGSRDDDAEYAAALALARKRAAATREAPPQVRYRRVLGALARRGFGAPIAHRAVRAALGGASDDE